MSNRKDVTSLDEDLASSRKVKYDNLQQQCKDWISARVSIDGKADLMDILHDGTVLCELCNTIDPSANLKYKTKKLPFMQMENIELFLRYAKHIGVPESELFQTVDLFEAKDPYQITVSLQSFSRYVNKAQPQVAIIGPQLSQKHIPPPVPSKPKHLVTHWSTHEYGRIDKNTETVVMGGRRDITGKPA